jgi:membrane protein
MFNYKIIKQFPGVKQIIAIMQKIKFETLQGISFYDIVKLYFIGILKGAVPQRASAISFSFFMALFPFALFILNLIPFIPINNFQTDFIDFVSQNVPPNTFSAIENILDDILNKSNGGLLSSGFFLSIFLMSNGINALLDGFEMSSNISIKRGYFRQFAVAICISIIIAVLLLVTVAAIVIAEIIIYKLQVQGFVSKIALIEFSKILFGFLMVLTLTSTLYKLGTRETKQMSFFSYGSVITSILFLISSYAFRIYVEKFARYNQLYGSIGTLLVMMIYIWINCILLIIGFELNAFIFKLKTSTNEKNVKSEL